MLISEYLRLLYTIKIKKSKNYRQLLATMKARTRNPLILSIDVSSSSSSIRAEKASSTLLFTGVLLFKTLSIRLTVISSNGFKFESIPKIVFERDLLMENGLLIIEHAPQTNLSHLAHFKEQRKYGSSVFSLFIFFRSKNNTIRKLLHVIQK